MAPPTAIDIEGVRDTASFALPDPLTVSGVSARRTKAGKLVAGTAAYTSSDYFKSPVCLSFILAFGDTHANLFRAPENPKLKDGTVSQRHSSAFALLLTCNPRFIECR